MKLYKHITRFQFRRMFSKGSYHEEFLRWAMTLKPGDVVSTCQGFNSRIKTIEPHKYTASQWHGRGRSPNRRGDAWWISEFNIVDTDGYYHTAPGGGCVARRESVEKIRNYWLNDWSLDWIIEQEKLGWDHKFTRAVVTGFQEGKSVIDEDGVLTPEFVQIRKQCSDEAMKRHRDAQVETDAV